MRSFVIRFAASVGFCAIVVSWYLIPDSFFVHYSDATVGDVVKKDVEKIKEAKKEARVKKEEKSQKKKEKDHVKQSVPFIVQAPHAQWDDPKYQDACEEASMIMADAWITDSGHISKNDAEEEMEKMFDAEKEIFGDVIDTSASDTAEFFEGYYGHSVEVRQNITMEEMYQLLAENKIIIVPANGKKLGNPNFTNGGPERHMLVVIGYDKNNGEFITNDPGTRVGRGYKYKDSILYNAIRDYETGNKKEISGAKKNVIIVKR